MGLLVGGHGVVDFPEAPALAPPRGVQNFCWERISDRDLVAFLGRIRAEHAAGNGLIEGRKGLEDRATTGDQLSTNIVGQRRPNQLVLHDEGEDRLQDGIELVAEPEEMKDVAN